MAAREVIGEHLTPGPAEIRIDHILRERIRPKASEGWLSLDKAAPALGVARQTVLHKVYRDKLAAVHLNRGTRSARPYTFVLAHRRPAGHI